MARHGVAGPGKAGVARHGLAGRGKAWHGGAGPGTTMKGQPMAQCDACELTLQEPGTVVGTDEHGERRWCDECLASWQRMMTDQLELATAE